jgi:hypothetical protein
MAAGGEFEGEKVEAGAGARAAWRSQKLVVVGIVL